MSRGGWVPILIVLAVTAISAVRAAGSRDVPGDFLRYHRAGRLVVTNRADFLYDEEFLRGQHVYADERAEELERRGEDADDFKEREYKYLPATAVMMAPFGALHPRHGHIAWAAWNGFLISLMIVVAWQWCSRGRSAHWMWLPAIALLHVVNDNINLGQLNPSAIVPATIGMILLGRKREVAAGFLVALGAVVKFMPGFLILWFAWKRRFRGLFAVVLGLALFGWLLPAAALGPAKASELTSQYIEVRSHHYTSTQKEDLPGHSIKSFVYRTLGTTKYIKGSGHKRVEIDISVTELPPNLLYWLVMGLNVAALLVVLGGTKGPLREWDDYRGPLEAGAMLVLLLLISPEARGPHFLYLTLPVIATAYGIAGARSGPEPRPWKLAAALGVVGALLLNTNSTRLLTRELSVEFTARCSLGFAAIAFLAALLLLNRRPHRAAPQAFAARVEQQPGDAPPSPPPPRAE